MADDGGSAEISMSIEETNKLRISLGLKPLDIGLSASDTAEKAAADNFAQKREAELKAQQVSELQEKLAKSKNKRDLKKKLDGKGLGEAEDAADATLDSLAWVERMKKRQTELALRKQKELEEQDRDAEREAKVASAAGLRVGHALDTMLDDNFQGETILVLKDTTIEENEEEGDELVSIKLLESEKTKKKLEAGKKKAMYDPMAEEDQNLLAQYDETISGPEKGAFVLGDEGAFSAVDEERRRQEVSQKLREQRYGLKGTEMTLDYSKTNEIRDYYTQEEESQLSTFKKVKKKDKKKSRTGRTTRILDEEDEFPVGGNEEEMDTRPDSFAHSNANAVIEDVNFVDDDELQGALARARRLASKKKAGMVQSTEAVADAILGRNGHATTDAGDDNSGGMVLDIEAPVEEEEEADPDMVISDTANFVRALQNRSVFQEQQAAQAKKAEAAKQRAAESAAEVRRRVKVEEEEAVKKEPEDGDGMDWQEAREGSAVPSEVKSEVKEESEDEQVGDHITDEPLVAAGLGATLALLGSRGALEKLTDDDKDKEGRIRKQQEWLKQQRIAELEKQMEKKRERERNREKQQKGKGGGGQQWEEEKTYAEEQAEERKRLRDLEEKFKNYKPEINIDYVDEFGRTMKQKEAFKFLSHRFHGKGSGKMKTEKRLQRIADEFQQAAASTADTPLGTVNALHERTKTLKQPHVVLQIGNRAAAQPEATKIRPSASQKKRKEAPKTEEVQQTSYTLDVSGGVTGQAVDAQGREKIAFGFGVKRKADEMKEGSPGP